MELFQIYQDKGDSTMRKIITNEIKYFCSAKRRAENSTIWFGRSMIDRVRINHYFWSNELHNTSKILTFAPFLCYIDVNNILAVKWGVRGSSDQS